MYISYYMRRDLKRLGLMLLLLAAAVGVWFWLNEGMKPALKRAEALSEGEPANACATLDSIPPRWWWHPERRARHALFYSKARDRLLVDMRSDSLILPAVEYYSLWGPDHYAMQSYYYAGRVDQNAGNPARAYAYFTFADRLADSLGDYHMGGLIARSLADSYAEVANYPMALEYALKSYQLFASANSNAHANYALYELALLFNSLADYQSSLDYSHRALSHYEEVRDSAMCNLCLLSISHSNIQLGRVAESKAALLRIRELENFHESPDWMMDYAYICAYKGKADSATYYIKNSSRLLATYSDSLSYFYRKSMVESVLEDHKSALDSYSTAISISNKRMRKALGTPIESIHSDYLEMKSQDLLTTLNRRGKQLMVIVALVVLLSIATIYFLRRREKKHQEQINEYINQADVIALALRQRESSLQEQSERIKTLLIEKFNWANRFSETLFVYRGTKKEQEKLYRTIKSTFEEFASTEHTQKTLEPIINESYNGLMSQLREELPDLREVDFQLICFLLLGFPSYTICVILSLEKDQLYNRISRLRRRLSSSESEVAKNLLLKL